MRKKDESAQLLIKTSSAKSTSVSPSRKRSLRMSCISKVEPARCISRSVAPYFCLKSKCCTCLPMAGKRAPSTTSTLKLRSSASSLTVSAGVSRRSGSRNFENRSIYTVQKMAIGRPIYANSNMERPRTPLSGCKAASSSAIPCTTRLVEVPMSVHIPPTMVAYESGMSNLVAGCFIFSAQRLSMGAKITTTGVLLRKAEMNEMVGSMRSCTLRMEVFLFGNRR